MFVSSYNTYIHTNASDKSAKQRFEKADVDSKSFNSELKKDDSSVHFKNPNLPIDYIAKSQVLNNKYELEAQKQQFEEQIPRDLNKTKDTINKFSGQNSLLNAKNAYENNSKMFSLIKIPHSTLDQTPKVDKEMPKKAQEAKELSMRHLMVNTYIANDNYYQITA